MNSAQWNTAATDGRLWRRGITLLTVAGLLLSLAGCGGGGGGTSGGTSGTGGGATTRATLTIDWPQRARSVSAPESALSATVTVTGGGANGGDLHFTVNRDTTKPDAYSGTYSAPAAAPSGQYTVTVRFYSQPDGGGSLMGTAQKSVTFTGGTTDLGDVAVTGTVASVAVAPGQSLAPGQSADLVFTAYTVGGAAVAAISPGSASYAITGGSSLVSLTNGLLQANAGASGLAQVTVTVDGKTSAVQTVGIGAATLPVTVAGSRGAVPLSDTVRSASGVPATRSGAGTAFSFPSGWFQQNTLTAPDSYGDIQFDHWEQNGQFVATGPAFAVVPADSGAAPLTAVYVPRPAPAGGFTPNFNEPDNVAWSHFPLTVCFRIADAAVVSRIEKGFDRWVNATGGAISYSVVSDPAQADVTVDLGNLEFSPNEKGVTLLSVSTVTTNGVPVASTLQGTISILSTAPSDPPQKGVDPLEVLAAHEFGHVLGIFSSNRDVNAGTESGHSPDPNDTMYGAMNITTTNAITARDIDTLENLYPGLFGGSRAVPVRRSR